MQFDWPHLPTIPVHDLTQAGDAPMAALASAEPARMGDLVAIGEATYPAWLLDFGDRRSRRWLRLQRNPYLGELDRIAASGLPTRGLYMLNLSYEWGCTTGAGLSPNADAPHMLRTLDWPLAGLGRNLVVAKCPSDHGAWLNLTWPGFVGSLTGLAPGRFAAAFNQPPMRKRFGWLAVDWLLERLRIGTSRALPPAHLLRLVFETCADFGAAKRMLCETPVAMRAFFVLCGTKPGEIAVIERTETRAYEHAEEEDSARCAANHWVAAALGGRQRSQWSEDRRRVMLAELAHGRREFSWLAPPVLNELTRLAAEMEPASGRLWLQGFEADGPATRVLRLDCSSDTPDSNQGNHEFERRRRA
ncbi:MAG: carcinine hydrolase/isopenicillin-N N-acyltransferase family protein [Dongiaceae bacterium]